MPKSRVELASQLALVALAVLACRSRSTSSEYFTSGCLTAGGQQLVLGGSTTARIDVATGAVVESRTEFKTQLNCLADGSVGESGAHVRRIDPEPGKVVVSLADGRTELECDSVVVQPGAGGGRSIVLEPALFAELGVDSCARLNVAAVRMLADGRALLAAGSVSGVRSSVATPGKMGFYALDLATGKASIVGSVFPSGEPVHIYNAVAYTATRDGSVIIGVYHTDFAGKDRAELRVFAHEKGAARELVTISDMRETSGVQVSDSGRFVGLRLTSPAGSTGRVDVIDVSAKRVAFSVPTQGTVAHVGFLPDDSVIVASSRRQVERRAPDGRTLWRVDLE